MCGYCIEYSAITLEPEDANNLLPFFGTTLASLYRPGGNISADIALQAWEQEPDAETRLAISLILLLREDSDLLIKKALRTASSQNSLKDGRIDVTLTDSKDPLLSSIRQWNQREGHRLLKNAAATISQSCPIDPLIPSLCLAVWTGFRFNRSGEWETAISALAGNWARHSPPCWNLTLWLRREARLALWLAGREDTARMLDEQSVYKIVTAWIEGDIATLNE